jgi:ATP-binding cassette, subfamily C, bacterial
MLSQCINAYTITVGGKDVDGLGKMKPETPFNALWALVLTAPKCRLMLLIIIMTLVGLTEGFGIITLVPLLEALGGRDTSNTAQSVMGWLSIPTLSLGAALLLVTGLTALRAALQYVQSILSVKLEYRLVDDLRLGCFGGLLHAEWRWLSERRSADHAALLITNIDRIGVGLHHALALAAGTASLLACLVAALALSWKIALIASMSGGILLVAFHGQRRRALLLGHDLGYANRALQGHIQEGLAGIRITKILRNETLHLSAFKSVLAKLRFQQSAFLTSSALSRAVLQIAGTAMLALAVYAAINWWHLSYAVLLPLVLVFARMVPMLSGLQQSYHYWLHAVPALAETRRLIAETAIAAEPIKSGEIKALPFTSSLNLTDVQFTYGARKAPALHHVSMQIPVRTTTAIIGESGAGKSTVADMMMGLIEPDSGSVTVDGTPIAGEARQRWRRSVAYVQQDAFLFNDSIKANLLWSCPTASNDDLHRALSAAAADFAFTLPDGIDTIVGDGGVRLSGGERQRIALARALMSEPSLLILDEATSALDAPNEAAIRKSLIRLHGNVTIVVIGHRLAMLEQADQVIVLENGRVVKRGPWQGSAQS